MLAFQISGQVVSPCGQVIAGVLGQYSDQKNWEALSAGVLLSAAHAIFCSLLRAVSKGMVVGNGGMLVCFRCFLSVLSFDYPCLRMLFVKKKLRRHRSSCDSVSFPIPCHSVQMTQGIVKRRV